jgi:hypothetical protein
VELLDLGVEIVEDWYSVHMVNFFWIVCLSVMVLGNYYIWIL